MGDTLRVGRIELTVAEAVEQIQAYTAPRPANAGITDVLPWSAYDSFAGGGPDELTDGELLTPVLLHVHMSIVGFLSFKRIRPALEVFLADVPEHLELADAGADAIASVARLFGVLDTARPHAVQLPTLGMVLHRKRPALIPLFDRRTIMAYRERVPTVPGRAAADLCVRLMEEMRADLRAPGWATVTQAALTGPTLTPLRALDIIGWTDGVERARTGNY
jgi:Family of unknown function (DUF6308)